MSRLEVLLGPGQNYSYAFSFPFEQNFDHQWIFERFQPKWHLCFYISFVYLATVFGIKRWMTGRKRLELNGILAAWNICLSVLSIIGAARVLPELVYVLNVYGLRYSICNGSFILVDKVSGSWSFMFNLCKVVELMDTVFIVLRKQRLLFLHWYHHTTVLILTWYFYASLTSLGRWFICMNYSVHSLMYGYYVASALRFNIPRPFAVIVTAAQICQTLFGMFVIVYSSLVFLRNEECRVTADVITLALFLYGTNFLLFAKLFYNSFLIPKCHQKRT